MTNGTIQVETLRCDTWRTVDTVYKVASDGIWHMAYGITAIHLLYNNASLILPVNMSLATEQNLAERVIIKKTPKIDGLLLMVNYESLFFFVTALFKGSQKKESPTGYYDGILGAPKYMLSLSSFPGFATIIWRPM